MLDRAESVRTWVAVCLRLRPGDDMAIRPNVPPAPLAHRFRCFPCFLDLRVAQPVAHGAHVGPLFDERRRVIVPLLNQLPGFTCLDPGGAFYVFPNVTGTGIGAKELQNRMLEQAGVATVAGTSFGIHGEGYIRFSYANSVENIREAIRRIAGLLRD